MGQLFNDVIKFWLNHTSKKQLATNEKCNKLTTELCQFFGNNFGAAGKIDIFWRFI